MSSRRRLRTTVFFGQVDATEVVVDGKTVSAMSGRATASLEIDPRRDPTVLLDYFSEITIGDKPGATSAAGFLGQVVKAGQFGDRLKVLCESMPDLAMDATPKIEPIEVPPKERIEFILRSAGLRDDQMRFLGSDELPVEEIETVVPLRGLAVQSPIEMSGLTIHPFEAGGGFFEGFEHDPWRDEFDATDSFAVLRHRAAELWDADTRSLAEVDLTVAWLHCRARYGLPYLPDGTPQAFRRDNARSEIARGGYVMSRSLESGRRWLHEVSGNLMAQRVALDPSDVGWVAPDSTQLSPTDAQALLAIKRCAVDPDAVQRVSALWEAVEFYVARLQLDRRWTKKDVQSLQSLIVSDDVELQARARELVGGVNSPPLLAKVRMALQADNVPFSESEFENLKNLRKVRNHAVHGRAGSHAVSRDDIDRGLGLVARALLFRLSKPVTAAP